MYRASPPKAVKDFEKLGVSAAEVFGVDFDLDDFVNVERSTMRHEGGYAQGEFALMPEKAQYDRIRVSFGAPSVSGDVTLQLWGVGSEGEPYLLGESPLSAGGGFPAIEFDNHQARYYLAVGSITGASAQVSVKAFIQGVYVAPYQRG